MPMSDQGEPSSAIELAPTLDLSEETAGNIDPVRARLQLAYVVLLVSAVGAYLFSPNWNPEGEREAAEKVFQWAATALLPLVTLILGYWFTRDQEEG